MSIIKHKNITLDLSEKTGKIYNGNNVTFMGQKKIAIREFIRQTDNPDLIKHFQNYFAPSTTKENN